MKKEDFNIVDIESLCRLYQEGRLDPEEENLLSALLPSCGFESDIIDETIFLIGLERIAGRAKSDQVDSHFETERRNHHGPSVPTFFKALRRIAATSIAAAAVISIVSFGWDHFTGRVSTTVCEVYVDGTKISENDPRLAIALNDYHKNMEMIAEMKRMEKEKIGEVQKMVRESIDLENKYQRMSNFN